MELRLGFDEALMRRYAARGACPLMEIYWEHDGLAYPGEGWTDFGPVVLGWWFAALDRLLLGSDEEDFAFMDGPYRLTARREGELLRISPLGVPHAWLAPLGQVAEEVIRAAELTIGELARLGIAQEERRNLEYSISIIRGDLAQPPMPQRRRGGGRRGGRGRAN